jgi:hypothetical protein
VVNELKQLEPLRRQAAQIRQYITHMQHLTGHSRQQSKAIRQCQIAFNRIVAVEIKKFRRDFGDDNYKVMEEIDCYRNNSEFSFRPVVIVDEIEKSLKNLHKLVTELTEYNTNSLMIAITDIRVKEFGELKNEFM